MQDKVDMTEEERVRWRFEYTESVRTIHRKKNQKSIDVI